MVSVIIPVYNVADYIDQCVESVVQQSFKDIEIFLINDGSTDMSREKCIEWEKKDSRIIFIDKQNEGQAACRNLGLQKARGEYVTFVDSDDWIDEYMIEELYNSIVKYDADIAMCESYIQHADGNYVKHSLQCLEEPVVNMTENPEFVLTVRYTMWSKLYKKVLFEQNEIVEPSIKFEDFAIVPIIYALANKIACVNKQLYYYRYRESSTVHDANFIFDRFAAVECLINNFQSRNMVNKWAGVLKRIFSERASVLMSQIYPLLNREYDLLQKKYYSCCDGNVKSDELVRMNNSVFGKKEIAVIGSYNLMITAKMVMNMWTSDFLHNHYCFSSIVSMMSEAGKSFYEIDLLHKSPFRRKHLIQDFTKSLAHKHKCEFVDVDYILIDFLEERFDVGIINEHYFTLSDAFTDIESILDFSYIRVDKFSNDAKKIWKNNCDRFVELLKRHFDPSQIILVKMYLTEGYGVDDISQFYSNIQEIRRINDLLSEYYGYFLEKMPQIKVIEPLEYEDWFTDKEFRHGCFPWHLNERAYHILKCKINDKIREVS